MFWGPIAVLRWHRPTREAAKKIARPRFNFTELEEPAERGREELRIRDTSFRRP
jgi:hypothetical protein